MLRLPQLLRLLAIAGLCGASALAGEAVSLHPASAMARIGGVDGIAPSAATEFKLEMVRGEREGLQVAVLPARDRTENVRSIWLQPQTPNAPPANLYRVVAVNHAAPPTEGMFVVPPRRLGLIPDVLLPLENRTQDAAVTAAKPGEAPLTYYVEFAAARETWAGDYEYRLNLQGEDWTAALRVTVTVRDVCLPERLPFRTATCWNWSLQDYYGRSLTLEEKQTFWRLCLDQRLSPCAFFSPAPDPAPAELAALADHGLSLVCLMQVSGRKPRLLSAKQKEQWAPLLRRWREELKANRLENDAAVLLADEPAADSAEICRQNAAWLKAEFPELKIWCATRPAPPWTEFVDVFDTVTAHSTDLYRAHSHDEAALAEWRKKNPFPKGEYWWFHSVEPYAPHTNVRLDNLPIEGRVSGWQSAKYKVDGYEYFWITDWSGNQDSKDTPWPDRAQKWKTGLSGAGTLCYPDEKMRPMPSLRLVNLRDGFEDWALLEMLSPRDARGEDPAPLRAVTRGLEEYTADPSVLLQARAAVIQELLARKAPPRAK